MGDFNAIWSKSDRLGGLLHGLVRWTDSKLVFKMLK